MPLTSKAFLAIWHDFDPALEAEWHRWHTIEHMPERVGVPGFLAGRRYMSRDAVRQRCFTMYESADISVFNSAPYLERLNNPTPWTRAVAPTFKNFTRGACRVAASAGGDPACPVIAGYALTIQLAGSPSASVDDAGHALTTAIAGRGTIVGAHLALCERAVTNVETAERKARSASGEEQFDGVLVVEGYDREQLTKMAPAIASELAAANMGLTAQASCVYDLVFYIRPAPTAAA